MPSIRYYNQSAPFWDFVAGLEDSGSAHPYFNRNQSDSEEEASTFPWGSWGGPWGGRRNAGRGRHHDMPHRPHGPPAHGDGPPPPPDHDGPPPPDFEHSPGTLPDYDGPHGPPGHDEKRGPPGYPPHEDGEPSGPDSHRRSHGCHGRRGGSHDRGFPGRGGRHGRGFKGHGPWGGFPFGHRGGPFGQLGGLGELAAMFQAQTSNQKSEKDGEFNPEVDVFDTTEAFIVHVSLPGAKKEDVGANWDEAKSELSIGGVIYRPGDEDFLNKLAMDERKVGMFDRKIRLGSRANPAHVDAEGISAKLEDGILKVTVPKMATEDYVDLKKVDIE